VSLTIVDIFQQLIDISIILDTESCRKTSNFSCLAFMKVWVERSEARALFLRSSNATSQAVSSIADMRPAITREQSRVALHLTQAMGLRYVTKRSCAPLYR
jgi:hypothetical protein